MSTPIERFGEMTKDIPRNNITKEVMLKARENVKQKRQEARVAEAEKLYEETFSVEDQIKKLNRELTQKVQGLLKTMGKLVNRIAAYERDEEPPQEQEQGQQQEN